MADKAILYDSSKCTACKGCQVACKCWNDLPSPLGKNENVFSGSYQNPPDVNGITRMIITFAEHDAPEDSTKFVEWAFGRRSCKHCTDAGCVRVCPAGALTKDEATGFVGLDRSKCIGCQYCSTACPFDVPRYEESGPLNQRTTVQKCTGCIDRVEQGMAPACVSTCQPNALKFGDRDEMLALAHERVEYLKTKGYPDACVYGETEMGGLHVISVLKYGIEKHGEVAEPKMPATVGMMEVMKPVTAVGTGLTVVGLAAMFGLAVGYKRRELAYNPETEDTIDVNTGEVVKHGDGLDETSVKDHIIENLPIGKGGRHE